MRTAYICADPGVPVFGQKGSSIHVQEVIRALGRRGLEVELFATRTGGQAPPELEHIPLHRLPKIGKGDVAAREQRALAANEGLQTALERAGKFDLVYERYSLWSFAGMEYARAAGVPGLLEVNAPLIEEQAEHRGLVDRPGAERTAERAFGAATALLAVSDGVAAYLENHPAAQGRVQVVPNGVNPDRFPAGLAPARLGDSGAFTVGFVGTLKPWHGLDVLVEAFAALHRLDPGARLLVVGDGPGRAGLEAELAARGLSSAAHLAGAVPPDAIPAWLASMDVAVAPYPDLPRFYFSPLKVYEYMAAGISVVASRIGQIAALIEDGVTGLLCPPGNPEALASALRRLRAEPGLRRRLGRAARATVIHRYTWDTVAGRILNLADLRGPG
ncbi:MAG: glycosyltransferase family 4 protein [Anaerolineae bacterium]